MGLSIRACQALAELLAKPGHLRQLHFRNNMSDDDGAIALAQVCTLAGVHVLVHGGAGLSVRLQPPCGCCCCCCDHQRAEAWQLARLPCTSQYPITQ